MKHKQYFLITAVIFLLVAVGHGLRVLNDWGVFIGNYMVPTWFSLVATLVIGYMAWWGFKFGRK